MEVRLLGKLRSIPFEPPLRGTTSLALGDLTMALYDAAVDTLHWRGAELLRGIAYPIRDESVREVVANGSATDKRVGLPGGAAGAVLDLAALADAAATPAWMDDAARPLGSQLQLPPYAVAFLSLSRPAERPR